METVREILEGDEVVLIRFTTLDNEGSPTLDGSETWCGAYVDDDRAEITVKSFVHETKTTSKDFSFKKDKLCRCEYLWQAERVFWALTYANSYLIESMR
jgi:hypothetical protein